MKLRNTLSALVVAAGTAAFGAMAHADVYVYDTTVTPPRFVDVVPSDRYAYPGHYAWDGTRYVWIGEPMAANDDDSYGRWSWVPDDFVDTPEAFLRSDDRTHG